MPRSRLPALPDGGVGDFVSAHCSCMDARPSADIGIAYGGSSAARAPHHVEEGAQRVFVFGRVSNSAACIAAAIREPTSYEPRNALACRHSLAIELPSGRSPSRHGRLRAGGRHGPHPGALRRGAEKEYEHLGSLHCRPQIRADWRRMSRGALWPADIRWVSNCLWAISITSWNRSITPWKTLSRRTTWTASWRASARCRKRVRASRQLALPPTIRADWRRMSRGALWPADIRWVSNCVWAISITPWKTPSRRTTWTASWRASARCRKNTSISAACIAAHKFEPIGVV